MQTIVTNDDVGAALHEFLQAHRVRKAFLVCDASYPFLSIRGALDSLTVETVRFDGFTSNPRYEDVKQGVLLCRDTACDVIIAVGGGSAMDVAKCVKLYHDLDPAIPYLEQPCAGGTLPLAAIPTTAGTGSESTRFAVYYYGGNKQSISHPSIVPDFVVLAPGVLQSLPLYQKKCTLVDALCQSVEAWWSVNSTEESRGYSREAVKLLTENWRDYLSWKDEAAAACVMRGANLSGRAICVAQTTAAHAMSYKLTSMYALPHGHAVALCMPGAAAYMASHMDNCTDKRGETYLRSIGQEIADALHVSDFSMVSAYFENMNAVLGLDKPASETPLRDRKTLCDAVNPTRLANYPVRMTYEAFQTIYEGIVG